MCVVKLLKWIALTINSILLIAGVIIAIFGVILWKTDFRSFDDSVTKNLPTALTKGHDVEPATPAIFTWLGKLVMSFGLFIVCLSIIGILALSCCQKCKCFLVVYLIILALLSIVQASIVAVCYTNNNLEEQVEKALQPVFIEKEKREESYKFILGTQVFLKCCAVTGFRDYYCAGVYDPYCNFGCTPEVSFDGKKELPVCPPEKRQAKGEPSKDSACLLDAKEPYNFTQEPSYSTIPDFHKLNLVEDSISKPSELPGCSRKIFNEVKANLKYVQITCVTVLCIEVFCLLVTIILLCKSKGNDGGEKKRKSSSSSSGSS